jgi:UDP-N-acetylmuramate dehydrogenase
MESLKPYHTFGLDVLADDISVLENREDCVSFLRIRTPRVLLGGGSDVLFTENFRGQVGLMRISGVDITEDASFYHVRASAGEIWHELVNSLTRQGIAGIENLALIPGTCGAAPVQNIGAYGCEFSDFCEYVEAVDADGSVLRLEPAECGFGYRQSRFKGEWRDRLVITAIGLRLGRNWQPRLDYGPLRSLRDSPSLSPDEIMKRIIEIRRSKIPDPKVLGNAGSFFQNPVVDAGIHEELKRRYPDIPSYDLGDGHFKVPAGWLIDRAGLKGFRYNNAGVYEKQALILVNYGGAETSDLVRLAKHVMNCVKDMFGIKLHPEVRIFGETGEISLD